MTPAATILLVLLWVLIIFHSTGAFLTLCNVLQIRDVVADLDADHIAHQPFQPKISLIVRCDPRGTEEPVNRIQEFISLNYTQYEVILIMDSSLNDAWFREIVTYFEMQPQPRPASLAGLKYPVRTYYRSTSRLYRRLAVVDKAFHPDDDLRYTGAAVCKADYMLFIASLENELIRNSLSNLAIMKMRSPRDHITPIRGVARYNTAGKLKGNMFRALSDLCNLRRIYVTGSLKGNDFGQFVLLEDISGRKGREEYVPQPQMYLHRPNTFLTYLFQLAPHVRYKTRMGKLLSYMELLIAGLFWGAAIHTIVSPGIVNPDFLFLVSVFLLVLTATTFSVLVGEILLRGNVKVPYVLKLLLLSLVESLLFCLFQPVSWIINKFRTCREI